MVDPVFVKMIHREVNFQNEIAILYKDKSVYKVIHSSKDVTAQGKSYPYYSSQWTVLTLDLSRLERIIYGIAE